MHKRGLFSRRFSRYAPCALRKNPVMPVLGGLRTNYGILLAWEGEKSTANTWSLQNCGCVLWSKVPNVPPGQHRRPEVDELGVARSSREHFGDIRIWSWRVRVPVALAWLLRAHTYSERSHTGCSQGTPKLRDSHWTAPTKVALGRG